MSLNKISKVEKHYKKIEIFDSNLKESENEYSYHKSKLYKNNYIKNVNLFGKCFYECGDTYEGYFGVYYWNNGDVYDGDVSHIIV